MNCDFDHSSPRLQYKYEERIHVLFQDFGSNSFIIYASLMARLRGR